MGLKTTGLPDPVHGHVTDAEVPGERPGRPVGFARRGRVEGRLHDLLDEGRGNGGVGTGARGVLTNPLDAQESEPLAPEADGVGASVEIVGDLLIGAAFGRPKDNPSSEDQSVRCGTAPGPGFEFTAFVGSENNREGNTHAPFTHRIANILSPNCVTRH